MLHTARSPCAAFCYSSSVHRNGRLLVDKYAAVSFGIVVFDRAVTQIFRTALGKNRAAVFTFITGERHILHDQLGASDMNGTAAVIHIVAAQEHAAGFAVIL